jgi:hypothetical protein
VNTAQNTEREEALAKAERWMRDTAGKEQSPQAEVATMFARALLASAKENAKMREGLEEIATYTHEFGTKKIARAALTKEP